MCLKFFLRMNRGVGEMNVEDATKESKCIKGDLGS